MGLSKSKKQQLELEKIHKLYKHKMALLFKKQSDLLKEYTKALDSEKLSKLRTRLNTTK